MGILYEILKLTNFRYEKGKLVKGMSLIAACEEAGITHQTFSKWRREDPEFAKIYEDSKSAMLELMRYQAKSIVNEALYGNLKLKDSERVNISLRFLEKTDEEFKDKKELEFKINNDFNTPLSELEERAKDLINSLKYGTEQSDEFHSVSDSTSEPLADGEADEEETSDEQSRSDS